MPVFRPLPMRAEEARRLAAAAHRPRAQDPDWCIGQLIDPELNWRWLVPSLCDTHSDYPEVTERVLALTASPQAALGASRKSIPPALLRLRAGIALLWLGNNVGLDIVLEALDGSERELRSAALEGISAFSFDVSWTDHAYKALFESCKRIFDDTTINDRMSIVSAMFDRPVPALADAMRDYLSTMRDFRRDRAAIWLLSQGHDKDVRTYADDIVNAPLPANRDERKSWYTSTKNLINQLKDFYVKAAAPASRSWAATQVLALLDRLAGAAQLEAEPVLCVRDGDVSLALHAIAADIPPHAIPLLARWAEVQSNSGWDRLHAFGRHARHAGAASVDVLTREMLASGLSKQGAIAGHLMAVAPSSRYAELARVIRPLFDGIPPQEEDSYGHSGEQEGMAGLAAALAQFDRGAAAHIQARLRELGPTQIREVKWALAGLTPARIAFLLTVGGATQAMPPIELQSFYSDGDLVRSFLHHQARLAVFNSHDDDNRSPALRVVSALALITVPQVELEAAMEAKNDSVCFVHAGTVYEISAAHYEDYVGAAAAFNQFLEHIEHPQRVFKIGNDGGQTDHDVAAFFCADPKRLPYVAAQLEFPVHLPGNLD